MRTFTADMARKNCDRHEALLEKRRNDYPTRLQKDIEIASSKGKHITSTLGTKDEEFITQLFLDGLAIEFKKLGYKVTYDGCNGNMWLTLKW